MSTKKKKNCRFVVGVGSSIAMAGSQSYLADISTGAIFFFFTKIKKIKGPTQIGFAAGMALGPALGGLLADTVGIRNCFLAVGATISGVVVNHYIMCPETLPKTEQGRKITWSGIGGEFKDTLNKWKPLWNTKDIRYAIYLHSVFWFTSSGCMFTLMPLYATNSLHMSLSSLGSLFAGVALINVFGSQPMAWISDKFGRKIVIGPSILILSSAAFLLPYVHTTQQLTALAVWWGIGSTMFQSAPMAYISDRSNAQNRSQALAILRSGGDFGLMLGSSVCAGLAQWYDMRIATTFAALCLLSSGFNFVWRTKY
ncbi:hypothetical protein RFI_12098 [Reticulomyxa filosa]|uniref:Major facilitator superfamily (MFS) profile domain-containing protein n=1 Tax=Reticulomyxa filosa TaxID=46433 RepID=X6NI62_RETFI|nr:hypothetical protein RFI_12098 [Reticulomyxa filosa]|eukprot:ETO25042.1 hypothetical protein RFI_12098 [Reticulomyxa filosa]